MRACLQRSCRGRSFVLQSRSSSTLLNTNHWVTKATDISAEALQKPGAFRLAVKDNISTGSLPTTCGSRILQGYTSPFEATIVRQLRSRNAVIVGTTNMDEFGMGSHSTNSVHGPVVNATSSATAPRSAGGSSGGSAVAVQVGDADVALGTDTGGSVRLPAAYTGIVGYKPSYGMLSRYGVVPYANSLDTVGLLASRVDDIYRLVFGEGIYMEHDPNDPTSLTDATRSRCEAAHGAAPKTLSAAVPHDPKSITIGIPLEYNVAELDPAIRAAWTAAAAALEAWGARVVPVSLPSTRHALSAYYVIAPAEASSNLAKYDGVRYGQPPADADADSDSNTLYASTRGSAFGLETQRRILLGAYSLSSAAMDNYFIQAQRVRRSVQRDFDGVFARENPLYDNAQPFDLSDMDEAVLLDNKLGPPQVDFILAPTAPTVAPLLEDVQRKTALDAYANDVFTVPASLAGLPAVSVPIKLAGQDDVAGLQLIAQFWDDARLLGMAKALSEVVDASS